MWESTVYLNGAYLPLGEAKISVLDRGFIFGDGIYEVVPIYNRKPFSWPQHYARLERSLKHLSIENPMPETAWRVIVDTLVTKNAGDNQFIYWQITRGVAKRDHAFPTEKITPTVFAMSSPFTPPTLAATREGMSGLTTVDNRWLRCEIKSISLLGNVLKRQEAVEAGAMEAIMLRDGFLTEGASANIYIVENGAVIAPPKQAESQTEGGQILEGIRYQRLQQLCAAAQLTLKVEPISKARLLAADEILLSSATKAFAPIVTLDEKPVNTGKAGPVWEKLFLAYEAIVQQECYA